MSVPILVTLLVVLLFNGVCEWAFNAAHPDELSQLFFAVGKQAVSHVMVSLVVALWIFVSLMNWAKAKFLKMEAEENADAAESDGKVDAETVINGMVTVPFKFRIASQEQDWYHTTRYLFTAILVRYVYGSVQLDVPKPHEKEAEAFWQDCDAFIYALFVDECSRKNRLAFSLLYAAEKQADHLGCKTVGLRWDDRESEPWVLEWYKRRGYEEIRVEADGHVHFLVKKLSQDNDDKKDE